MIDWIKNIYARLFSPVCSDYYNESDEVYIDSTSDYAEKCIEDPSLFRALSSVDKGAVEENIRRIMPRERHTRITYRSYGLKYSFSFIDDEGRHVFSPDGIPSNYLHYAKLEEEKQKNVYKALSEANRIDMSRSKDEDT